MTFKLLIRTQPVCAHCNRAKAYLDALGLPYEVQDHETREKVEAFIAQGYRTFPQVFDDGEHIGGADELNAYLNMVYR